MIRSVLLLSMLFPLATTAQTVAEAAKQQRVRLCKEGKTQFCEGAPEKDKHKTIVDDSWMKQGLLYSQQQSNANQVPEKSVDYAQLQIIDLSCRELGVAILRSRNPNLDIPFPGRGSWEQDLCQSRNAWKVQYDRYAAHKGRQGEMDEEKRASDLWEAFQSAAWVGIGQAILTRDKKN